MSAFKEDELFQEIVGGLPALLKKNPRDYFALVGVEEITDTRIQIPVAAGLSWVEHAEENLGSATACLMGIFHGLTEASVKKVALVTISENDDMLPLAELAQFIASLTGIEIIAELRVPEIAAGAPIRAIVDRETLVMTQIEPTDSQAHEKTDPWAPPADSDEFETMLRNFFNEG